MTRKELVVLDLEVKDKLHLFEKIAAKAVELGVANNKGQLVEDFYARERTFETYLDSGCAIPHVKSSNVNESCIFFIRLKKAIKWSDEDSAKEIFAILAKEEDADLHIDMLMNVSKKVMNKKYLSKMQETNKVEDIVEIINK